VSLVVLDTDVASLSFRLRLPGPLSARLVGQTPCVTFVTVGELTKWTRLRSWGPQRLSDLARWMGHVTVLPYDRAVAVTWGELQARAQLRGRPRPVNDSWIAACCIVHDLPFATLNHKDFEDFDHHEGLRLLDG
jgi:toxin FitB